MRAMIMILLVLLVAGCASQEGRPTLGQIEDVYLRHAGNDAQSVMFGNIRSWHPAGMRMLVIELGPRRNYLVELAPPCEMNLRYEPSIRVVNAQRGILSRFDSIQVGRDLCRIVRLRSIDMQATRADLERLRLEVPAGNKPISETSASQESGGT